MTSRHLRDRLFRSIEKNLAMRVEETDSPDRLLVYGRGILHLEHPGGDHAPRGLRSSSWASRRWLFKEIGTASATSPSNC